MNAKKIFIAIGLFLAGIAAFLFGRNTNGGGIQCSDELADGIGNSIDESEKVNNELGERIDSSKELAGDIKRDNQSAIGNVRTAKDILKRAKEKADNNTG